MFFVSFLDFVALISPVCAQARRILQGLLVVHPARWMDLELWFQDKCCVEWFTLAMPALCECWGALHHLCMLMVESFCKLDLDMRSYTEWLFQVYPCRKGSGSTCPLQRSCRSVRPSQVCGLLCAIIEHLPAYRWFALLYPCCGAAGGCTRPLAAVSGDGVW